MAAPGGGRVSAKYATGVLAAAAAVMVGTGTTLAQTDTASAGNGGIAGTAANGGAASTGDINSGGNVGNAIGVGNTMGLDPQVNGGDVLNSTSLDVTTDGGTAIADATGGNNNLAFVS